MKKRCDVPRCDAVLIAALLAIACGDRESRIAGANRTIQNTLVAELGKNSDSTSIQDGFMVDVLRHPKGGWLVLQMSGGQPVLSYDDNGKLLRSLGTLGLGPQEFAKPARMVMDGTDSLWVSHKRGRAVVFSPEGVPVRTILNANLFAVDGFTPAGLPFSDLQRRTPVPPPETKKSPIIHGFVQVLTRNGDPLVTVGPGALDTIPNAMTMWSPFGPPYARRAALSDTTFVSPGGWETWLFKWTPSGQIPLTAGASVRESLSLGKDVAPESVLPISVISDGAGGLWMIGSIRRKAKAAEDSLKQSWATKAKRSILSLAVMFAPAVRNAIFDGALLHLTEDGKVNEGITFDEQPWGFADKEHYFTFQEAESGLIKTRVWKVSRSCR